MLLSVSYSFSANDSLSQNTMPNIPGMPTTPPLPTFITNTTPLNETTGVVGTPKDYTTVQGGISPLPKSNVSQSHIEISLPGMPPITVSTSLPQNTSFYTSVLQQNELTNVTTIPTTVSPTVPLTQ